MSTNLEKLNSGATEYFKSLENTFRITLRMLKRIDLINTITSFSILITLILALVELPNKIADKLNAVYGPKFISLFGFKLNLNGAWLIWVFFALFWVIYFWAFIRTGSKIQKKVLSEEQYAFCLLYSITQELKSYMVNNHPIHLEKAKRYIKIFRPLLETKNPLKLEKEQDKFPALYQLVDYLNQKYPWIHFSEETTNLINAYKDFDQSIIPFSLKEKNALVFIGVFETLYLISYLRTPHCMTTADKYNFNKNMLKDEMVINFQKEVALKKNMVPTENPPQKTPLLKKFLSSSNSLLYSKNLVICFISWYFLWLLIIGSIIIMSMLSFSLNMDSTLLIGLLTIPSVFAITIVQIIKQKT